jgi:hypothetical protein
MVASGCDFLGVAFGKKLSAPNIFVGHGFSHDIKTSRLSGFSR